MPHTLYKLYYGDHLVYIGRTNQPLKRRLHGHFFKKTMHRNLDIHSTSKIEYAELHTEADMYVYEVYLINLLKPPLNCDDKSREPLTVHLPEIKFKDFECDLMGKWREQLKVKDGG